MRVVVTVILMLATVAGRSRAQDSTKGPTLAETKAWIESELPRMAHSHESNVIGATGFALERTATDFRLEECKLSWTLIDSTVVSSRAKSDATRDVSTVTVPLKEVDVAGVNIFEPKSFTALVNPVLVRVPTRAASTGAKIQRKWLGADAKNVDFAPLPVATRDDGERVVKAIRRAAVLCGAPTSPF